MSKLRLTSLALLCHLAVQAQVRTVRGRVTDAADKQPLPGVAVTIVGSASGVTTNAAGRFSLKLPATEIKLTVSQVGYVSRTVTVKPGLDSIAIALQPDTRMLNEVVVTGYGTPMRREVTGSVAVMSAASSSRAKSAGAVAPRVSKTAHEVAYTTPHEQEKQAGQLTAGEIHDYSKWTLWQDITKNEFQRFSRMWQIAPAERYSVQLVSADGFPVIDAPVRLFDAQGQVLWQARTDNTGRGELWLHLLGTPLDSARRTRNELTIDATVGGKTYTLNKPKPFGTGDNSLTTGSTCAAMASGNVPTVDVAFVVDATGSMGDEIAYLKAELTDVIGRAKRAMPGSSIRLGSVFYRDKSDEYLTRHRDFDSQPDSAVAYIKEQFAAGGGDYPEAVDTALHVALTQLSWSQTAKARLLFLVLDAPPHEDSETIASLQRAIAKAAAMGVRLIPVAASGIDKSTEYLLRSMALGTNGTYVFLTDDSGIGDSHIKPTTDQYMVEKLNALLVRLMTKFTQTPDCQPQTVANNVPATPQSTTNVPGGVPPVGPELGQPNVPDSPTFRYFPNPTRDYLTIESQKPISELFVMDITGKVLMRETPDRPTARLDMQPYPTGTYLFRFNAAESWQSGKFLLNR